MTVAQHFIGGHEQLILTSKLGRLTSPPPVSDDFPSGPWRGFYTYDRDRDRHRMDLSLEFGKGMITGEGTDDIGPFVVRGRYDAKSKECHWTKTYVGMHDVFYSGIRQGKGIHGTWEVGQADGGFKMWPLASSVGDEDADTEEGERPVEALGELVGASALGTFRARVGDRMEW